MDLVPFLVLSLSLSDLIDISYSIFSYIYHIVDPLMHWIWLHLYVICDPGCVDGIDPSRAVDAYDYDTCI